MPFVGRFHRLPKPWESVGGSPLSTVSCNPGVASNLQGFPLLHTIVLARYGQVTGLVGEDACNSNLIAANQPGIAEMVESGEILRECDMTEQEHRDLWQLGRTIHEARIAHAWGPKYVNVREPWPDWHSSYLHSPIAYVDLALASAKAVCDLYEVRLA